MEKRTRIELHCHTKMSAGKGLIEPEELVRYACDNGYKAIAITDCGTVQAFPEAYRTWKKLWEKHRDECEKRGEEARKEDFLKVIYGLEGYLTDELYPVLLYAKNETGIRNLYRIVTEANIMSNDENPTITKESLDKHRDGILVVAMCDGGEVMNAVHAVWGARSRHEYIRDLKNIMSYYDFIEVSPFGTEKGNDERYLYHVMINGGMLVAASDAYYLNEEDKIYWDILTNGRTEEYTDRPRHLVKWDEKKNAFGCWFSGQPEIQKEIPKMVIANQSVIADQIEYVSPLREGKFLPVYPGADDLLRRLCEKRAQEVFEGEVPKEIRARLDTELDAICQNGYAGIYMMWRSLVEKSLDKGFQVCSRGSMPSSLVAYLSGITEINPLSEEYGGYNIPAEVFMGLDLDKEPDIDINFAPCIQELIQNSVADIPGVNRTCYAGTISRMGEKTAKMHVREYYTHNDLPMPDEDSIILQAERICGVKKCDGFHPGGIMVLPEGIDFFSFTPLQHPWSRDRITSHFEYHDLCDNLLKLNILGYPPLERMHELQELTGVAATAIPMNDERVLEFIYNVERDEIDGLPEFGSRFVRDMIRDIKPTTYDDLIKISGLCHGTGVWHDNQRELVLKNGMSFDDCIAFRDDIYLALFGKGLDRSSAYRIMESVRKGKGLTKDMIQMMREACVSELFIEVCQRIKYLFPKAHAASYMLVVWRLAYYMLYFPTEYDEACRIAE